MTVGADGPRRSSARSLQVTVTLSSVLLVIGAVVAAIVLGNVIDAARRPLAWVVAASVIAWLVSGVIDIFARRMRRPLAVATTLVALVLLEVGGAGGERATLGVETDRLSTTLPAAARDLEARFHVAADFRLAERTQAFVDRLHDRFGTHAQIIGAVGSLSTYVVTGILTLFMLVYGSRFVAAALEQIDDPTRREALSAILRNASSAGRLYLLIVLAQAAAVVAVCSVAFYLLSLPAPFVLALIVGWLSVVPYFGFVLGGFAPLIAAATRSHAYTYIILSVLLVGFQVLDVTVVRPYAERRSLRVGPTMILIGVLLGYDLCGFAGAFFGMTILVELWALLRAMPDRSYGEPPSDDGGRPTSPPSSPWTDGLAGARAPNSDTS